LPRVTLVEGHRRFEAPRERVFELLTNPDVIAAAMPAVRSHDVIDADHWLAKVKPPLPLAPTVTIRFEVMDRRPPEHARLHAHGGGADVTSTFDLEDDGGATVMHWQTELQLAGILGKLAGPGGEVVARRQADRTLDEVTRRL
jgi:carbon monoxide dehydrogenase subunit G